MKKIKFILLLLIINCSLLISNQTFAQNKMTPELLWKLGRVGGIEISPDGTQILFGITYYKIEENKGNRDLYVMPIEGGEPKKITDFPGGEYNAYWRPDGAKIGFLSAKSGEMQLWEIKPDGTELSQISQIKGGINAFKYHQSGKSILFTKDVKLDETVNEKYPDLPQAQVRVIDDLMYRHWNQWHDYAYSHVFFAPIVGGQIRGEGLDIMKDQKYDSPLNPFGGIEQISWNYNGQKILYTCKKLEGKSYTVSTNSDIFSYDLQTNQTQNITKGMMGYDMNPSYSNDGKQLAWLSMKRDGFESDKNDIIILDLEKNEKTNLTAAIDLTVSDFIWNEDGKKMYFLASINATYQLFEINLKNKKYRQITQGDHNYRSLALAGEFLIGSKQNMNSPTEIYKVNIKSGEETQLTFTNKKIYETVKTSKIEKRFIKTTDGKDMLTWVIYPPDFNPNKKYPTLLYCQGGPQSAVSQFFSYRWNFQLMAANGYIVVAPNRRGLPSFGQKWNDDISKDWGGQCMKDYLSAIDSMAKEPFVDENKLGAVGASFGGYSVYYLAGNHEKRFKTFISHCGLFNLESWYGTTEEMFFANWDVGAPYWNYPQHQSYKDFSPHKFVQNWDAPIMVIHSEKDFRVPIGEGIQAFQAAQLRDVPSRFLYFPSEGHWVQQPQNGLVWHREFFEWLDMWLK